MGNDLSIGNSINATEQNFLAKDDPVFAAEDGTRERDATQEDFFEGNSAVFSNVQDALSRNATEQDFVAKSNAEFGVPTDGGREREGTEVEQLE